jgi:hypothetical protein
MQGCLEPHTVAEYVPVARVSGFERWGVAILRSRVCPAPRYSIISERSKGRHMGPGRPGVEKITLYAFLIGLLNPQGARK